MHSDHIDGGLAVVEEQEVGHTVRGEVVHADGTHETLVLHLSERAPCAVIVVVRLVDERQIHVVHAESFQGAFHTLARATVAGVGDPQLGGDEDFAARGAAVADCVAHRAFVAIGSGRVDEAIAGLQSLGHRIFAYIRIGHAEYSVADAWHAVSVVQRQIAVVRIH